MITLNNCNIIVEDDIHPVVECKGVVIINGDSPNAKVRLTVPDYDGKRFRGFDRLTEASYTESGGSYTIRGVSSHLKKTVAARKQDALMTVLVTPDQPCVEALDEPEELVETVVTETVTEEPDRFFIQFTEEDDEIEDTEEEKLHKWRW